MSVTTTRLGPVSAYAIAVEHGFVGTEEEWLESLQATQAQVDAYFNADPTRRMPGNGSITTSKLAREAVTTEKLAAQAVTQAKLGSDVLDRFSQLDNEVEDIHLHLTTPYIFKGSKASAAELPAAAAGNLNHTYYLIAEKYRVTSNGSTWEQSSMGEEDYTDELAATDTKVADVEGMLYAYSDDDDITAYDLRLGWLVRTTDGACVDQESDLYLSTNDYIPVTNETKITVDAGYVLRVAYYTGRNISSFVEMLANWDESAIGKNGYIRISIKKSNGESLTLNDADAIHVKVPELKKMWARPGVELIDLADTRQNWRTLNASGEIISSSIYNTTDLIPVSVDDAYTLAVTMHKTTDSGENGNTRVLSANYYDKEQGFIGTLAIWSGSLYSAEETTETVSVEKRVPIPTGAYFLRIKWIAKYTDSVSLLGSTTFDKLTSDRVNALEISTADISRAPKEVLSNSAARVSELISVARTYRDFALRTDRYGNYYLKYGAGCVLDVSSASEVKGIDCSGFVGLVLRGIPVGMTPYIPDSEDDADYIPPAPGEDIEEEDMPDSDATGLAITRNPAYSWSKDLYMWKEYVSSMSRAPFHVRAAAQIASWFYGRGREVPFDPRFMDAEPGDVICFQRMLPDGTWSQPNRFRHVSHVGIITERAANPNFNQTKAFSRTDITTYPYIHTYIHCSTFSGPCVQEESLEDKQVAAYTSISGGTIPASGVSFCCMICRPDLGNDVVATPGTPTESVFGSPGKLLADSNYLYVAIENPNYDPNDVTSNPVIWKKIPLI